MKSRCSPGAPSGGGQCGQVGLVLDDEAGAEAVQDGGQDLGGADVGPAEIGGAQKGVVAHQARQRQGGAHQARRAYGADGGYRL